MSGCVDLGSDYQEEDEFDLHFSEESTLNWLQKTLDEKVARLQSEMI